MITLFGYIPFFVLWLLALVVCGFFTDYFLW